MLWNRYDYLTHQKFAGGTKVTQAVTQASIPVFRRGGSIIFTKERVRRSSPLQAKDPYTITIALDKNGTSANGKNLYNRVKTCSSKDEQYCMVQHIDIVSHIKLDEVKFFFLMFVWTLP